MSERFKITPAHRSVLLFVVAAAAIVAVTNYLRPAASPQPIPYSDFQRSLREGHVHDLVIGPTSIRGAVDKGANERVAFETNRVEASLAAELDKRGVTYAAAGPESTLLPTLLSWFAPILLFLAAWFFIVRRASRQMSGGAGFMSIGKSKAKVYVESDTKVSFEDVAGVDEAKQELEEVVAFLKDPDSHGRLGARMPKGVLLVGPPGTGKTLLARAVAGEAAVPFLSISGPEFVEMFVGVGAARVRDLFQEARQKAPCIIFIDELDALGRARNSQSGFGGGHDEKEQTLNQLLAELDGFNPSLGIVLLGATNRPEILDPALLRAGRFDRQILVDRPDKRGRVAILKVHMTRIKAAADAGPDGIAALTPGFTGAELANLVNEAALVATRRNAVEVTMNDFTLGVERIVAGLEKKNRLLVGKEKRTVAHHEMGHALVAAILAKSDVVHKVSIIPRGVGALGYTIHRPTEDRYLMDRNELDCKMSILLGGRAAEDLAFGHLSTGAADDLVKATDIARSMVTRFAMEPKLGHAVYDSEPQSFLGPVPAGLHSRSYSEETARQIDHAIREILERAYQRARAVLKQNRSVLDEGAKLLLEKETLDEGEMRTLFASLGGETPPELAPLA